MRSDEGASNLSRGVRDAHASLLCWIAHLCEFSRLDPSPRADLHFPYLGGQSGLGLPDPRTEGRRCPPGRVTTGASSAGGRREEISRGPLRSVRDFLGRCLSRLLALVLPFWNSSFASLRLRASRGAGRAEQQQHDDKAKEQLVGAVLPITSSCRPTYLRRPGAILEASVV